MSMRPSRPSLLLALAALLAGCGGGGHSNDSGSTGGSSSSLTFTAEPTSKAVALGGTATFTAKVTGTNLSYQWYRNSVAIAGATNATYTTAALTTDDNGATFYVIVSSDSGSAKSSTATLTVGSSTGPVISAQPASVTAPIGDSATFTVVASGDDLTYQWYKNSTAISGATSASYTVSPIASGSAGTYYVIVSNAGGSVTSSKVTLSIGSATAPVITTQPGSQTVASGARATFSVVASGSGTLTYQWYQNGNAIAGATGSSYQFTATAVTAGSYTVTVTNSLGTVTSNAATLTVLSTPTITSQPTAQTAFLNQSATFSVVATGGNLTYQWFKDGTAISGANSSTYTVSPVLATSAGTYKVTVSNTAGSVSSTAVTLTVYGPPTITTQPVSVSVGEGSTATFTVGATGNSLTFQWYKNGSAISGATSTSFTTPATALTDSGATYFCVATNPAGSATSNTATLTVIAKPTITTQPTNVTVTAPATATFTVTATVPSGGALTYAWYRVGSTTVVGTAASYTTPATDSSYNNAQYYCIVYNQAIASVQSNTVTLTVH